MQIRKYWRLAVLLMGLLMIPSVVSAVTPKECLDKARAKLASASSLSADFTMKVEGQTIKGHLDSKGNKFSLVSNANSNWYNGRELYTYVPSQSETTVFKPTASELAEVNPLLYINTSSEFKVSGTKTKKPGLETVVLIPKKSGTGVSNVVIDFDANSFLPRAIKLTPSTGKAIEISISNVKLNPKLSDSAFEYPKEKYKKVKIIDMR